MSAIFEEHLDNFSIYELSEQDCKGDNFSPENWRDKGPSTISLTQEKDGNYKIHLESLSSLVHPESYLKSTSTPPSVTFWTWTEKQVCLELQFPNMTSLEKFTTEFKLAQKKMDEKHYSTKHIWSYYDSTKLERDSSTVKTELVEREFTSEEDDETHLDEDSESDCSEISLPSYGSEIEGYMKNSTGIKFPSLEEQKNMWYCDKCRTPNPKDKDTCASCDAVAELKKEAVSNATPSKQEESASPFQFSDAAVPDSKPSFDFSANKEPSSGAFSFGATSSTSANPAPAFSFSATNETKHIFKEEEPKDTGAYPPMETMKKVEQVFPGQPNKKSVYPPVETMKKVEQIIPGQTKSSGAYPPMETMKKVEQIVPGQPKNSGAYPPMETMKKVEQVVPGQDSNKQENEVKEVNSLFGKSMNLGTTAGDPKTSAFSFSSPETKEPSKSPFFNFNSAVKPEANLFASSTTPNATSNEPKATNTFGAGSSSNSTNMFGTTEPTAQAFSFSSFGGTQRTATDNKKSTSSFGSGFGNSGFGSNFTKSNESNEGAFSSSAPQGFSTFSNLGKENGSSGFSFSSFSNSEKNK
eukprot:maker-scaffold_11-snap-gene-9.43-mRNA-1 protein AED:0.00 eAED:0.00 QI:68/1/1/1/1/1/2/85/580